MVSVLPPRVVRATTLQAWQDQDPGGRGAPPLHLPAPLSLGAESRDHDCGSLCQGVSPPMTLKSLATPQPRLSPPPRGQFCALPGSAVVPSCLATPPHSGACDTEASHQTQALSPHVSLVAVAGARPVTGQCQRHAVPAEAMEQADPERTRTLHPDAALAERRAGPGRPARPRAAARAR